MFNKNKPPVPRFPRFLADLVAMGLLQPQEAGLA
jgi:hypothetical protein